MALFVMVQHIRYSAAESSGLQPAAALQSIVTGVTRIRSFVKSSLAFAHSLVSKLQFVSASLDLIGHGNDALKIMGIIAVLLYIHGMTGGEFEVPF